MDLLSLILVFLALAVCVSIAYIAWELTAEKPSPRGGEEGRDAPPSDDPADRGE